MIIHEHPAMPWLERKFECQSCGAIVEFVTEDLGDMKVHWQPRYESMTGAWTGRACCAACKSATASFKEVSDAAP